MISGVRSDILFEGDVHPGILGYFRGIFVVGELNLYFLFESILTLSRFTPRNLESKFF